MEILNLEQKACLETLVGISQVTCDCYPEVFGEKEALVKTSKTGMYIDQDDGISGVLLLSQVDCNNANIFDWLISSRRKALEDIIILSALQLSERFEPRTNLIRLLGTNTYSNLLTGQASGTKIVSFKSSKMSGGIIKITGLGFVAKLASGVQYEEIEIVVKKDGEELETINFTVMNDPSFSYARPDPNHYALDEPIFLPTDGSEYSFSFVYDASKMYLYDTKLTCGCQAAQNQVGSYFKQIPNGQAYGLFFSVQFSCDTNFLLCGLIQENKTLEGLVGKIIIYKTLSNFLTKAKILSKTQLSASNVIKVVDYDSMIETYETMFSSALSNLVNSVNINQYRLKCFKCRTGSFAKRVGLIL